MGRKRTVRAVIITLILTALIIGGLAFFFGNSIIKQKDQKIKELGSQISQIDAYAFTRDIKAGSIIVPGDIQLIRITNTSKSFGTFLKSTVSTEDEDGNTIEWAEYYTGQTESTDKNGNKIVTDITNSVKLNDYIYGRAIKNNVSKNTLVMDSLFYAKNDIENIDERIEELSTNYLSIPSDLAANDYFDVRLRYANGEDYIVLVGKKVDGLGHYSILDEDGNIVTGAPDGKSFYTKFSEEERMVFGSALVEAFINNGAYLYATKYINPATQLFKETIVDYVALYESGVKSAMERKDFEKMVEFWKSVSGDVATMDALPGLPEQYKEFLKHNISPTKADDIKPEDVSAVTGMKLEYAQTIYDALKADDENKVANDAVLNYFRKFKVQTKTPLERTYVVTEAVYKAVEKNPNLVGEVKIAFEQRAQSRVTRDRFKELEDEYIKAQYDPEKSKSALDEIQKAVDDYESAYQDAINEQQKRREYLLSLIYGESNN